MEDLAEEGRRSAEQKKQFKEEFAGYCQEIDDFLKSKAYGWFRILINHGVSMTMESWI